MRKELSKARECDYLVENPHGELEKTVEKIGEVDILFIPVGGNYTIDDKKAWNVIKKIKPKIIIPMHYKIGGLSLQIAGLDPFLEHSEYKVIHVGNEHIRCRQKQKFNNSKNPCVNSCLLYLILKLLMIIKIMICFKS